jgi:hypothetical protein
MQSAVEKRQIIKSKLKSRIKNKQKDEFEL